MVVSSKFVIVRGEKTIPCKKQHVGYFGLKPPLTAYCTGLLLNNNAAACEFKCGYYY